MPKKWNFVLSGIFLKRKLTNERAIERTNEKATWLKRVFLKQIFEILKNKRTNERKNERTNNQTNAGTHKRTNKSEGKLKKILEKVS